jgi:hypothetical protein
MGEGIESLTKRVVDDSREIPHDTGGDYRRPPRARGLEMSSKNDNGAVQRWNNVRAIYLGQQRPNDGIWKVWGRRGSQGEVKDLWL